MSKNDVIVTLYVEVCSPFMLWMLGRVNVWLRTVRKNFLWSLLILLGSLRGFHTSSSSKQINPSLKAQTRFPGILGPLLPLSLCPKLPLLIIRARISECPGTMFIPQLPTKTRSLIACFQTSLCCLHFKPRIFPSALNRAFVGYFSG